MRTHYPDDMTMRAARDRYFEVNGFGKDGGYDDAWVDFKLGPIPMPFPNTAGRIKAVRFHDLHHILTGYDTNATGEFEISAWEIGAGCRSMPAAWVINMGGLASGTISAPKRIFGAFVRGRRSRTLYGETFEPLLERTVAEMRADHIGSADRERANAGDVVAFVGTALLAVVVGLAFAAVMLPLVPVGLVAAWLRRRQATPSVSA
ncbi:MAG: hypothetical protein JWO86_4499 [Myxococcaceae bacterium]|nr:hypothetical protein [Myxococcaceae bacterium]